MKWFVSILLFGMLLAAGCVTPPQGNAPAQQGVPAAAKPEAQSPNYDALLKDMNAKNGALTATLEKADTATATIECDEQERSALLSAAEDYDTLIESYGRFAAAYPDGGGKLLSGFEKSQASLQETIDAWVAKCGSPQAPSTSQPQQAGPSEASAIDLTWYSALHFFLYYPKGWTVQDPPDASVFVFASPQENRDDAVLESFIVEIWEGNESTTKEFLANEPIGEGDELVAGGWMIIDGHEAYLVEYEGNEPNTGTQMHYAAYYFRNGKWVYRLHYNYEISKKEKYAPIFEAMISQFKVGTG